MLKTAFIAGGTGLTGSELLKILLQDAKYGLVYSAVRTPSGIVHPKLKELIINFDDIPYSLSEIKSVDDVFCCLGTTIKNAGTREKFRKVDYEYPLAIANWAREIKASHFLCITAMGANEKSNIYYNKVKGETERDISLIDIPAITFFRPSLLLGDRKEKRVGEKVAIIAGKAISFLMTGPLENYKPIEAKDVAKAMVIAAHSQRSDKLVIKSGLISRMVN
jgi:uncharacterized protein YbjT (DUF2867 family)